MVELDTKLPVAIDISEVISLYALWNKEAIDEITEEFRTIAKRIDESLQSRGKNTEDIVLEVLEAEKGPMPVIVVIMTTNQIEFEDVNEVREILKDFSPGSLKQLFITGNLIETRERVEKSHGSIT